VRHIRSILGSAAACSLLVAGVAFAAAAAPKPVTIVSVSLRDYRFVLSRAEVPVGRVRFRLVNRGATAHDFAIAGHRSRILQPGQRQTLTIAFKRASRQTYLCTVPGHAALGMKGLLTIGAATVPKTTAPVTTAVTTTAGHQQAALKLTQVGSFERPVLVASPPGDTHDAFVVSQGGVIHELVDGVLQPAPFLDISDRVKEVSEPGLLGLAFAPDYATTGHFYVDYNQRKGNGDLAIVEYTDTGTRPVDPDSGRVLMEIVKPYENHNGGMLEFGRDGDLYISVGDGDSGVNVPPGYYSQRLDSLLGKILRIDPHPSEDKPYTIPPGNPFAATAGARPEIWAYGFRNPWRFDIDPAGGDMLIGDVGEGQEEELDLIPSGTSGQNFGFPCLEGTLPFNTAATCDNPVAPVAEFAHADSTCATIGGVYMHDPRIPSLAGEFLTGDLCDGTIEADAPDPTAMTFAGIGLHVDQPTSFGVDGLGRVYVCSLLGPVYRIDPAH
jgi:glucose/arabinose dehydrogenase